MQLGSVLRRLRAGDGSAALRELLAAWRVERDPRLGAAIVALGDRSEADPARALWAVDPKDRHQAWVDRLRSAPDEELSPLLHSLVAYVEIARGTWPIIERLSEHHADPRVADAAFAMLERFGRIRHPSEKLARRLAVCVERHGDARICERYRRGAGRLVQIHACVDRLRARWPVAETPPEHIAEIVAAIDEGELALDAPASDGASLGEELLRAVLADPGSDAHRRVYGDWLSEQEDPRGEFIALQFRHRDGALDEQGHKRMQALQKAHQQTWLAPIWPALALHVRRTLAPIVFERGFLAEASATIPPRPPSDLWERPEWSTVRKLGLQHLPGTLDALRSLEVLILPEDTYQIVLPLPETLRELHFGWDIQTWGEGASWQSFDAYPVDEVVLVVRSGYWSQAPAVARIGFERSAARRDRATLRLEPSSDRYWTYLLSPLRQQPLRTLTIVAEPSARERLEREARGCAAEIRFCDPDA